MKPFEAKNGFVVYDESDIAFREYAIREISTRLYNALRDLNSAWRFHRVETPLLIPSEAVSKEYDENYYFKTGEDLALRPETTWCSYEMLRQKLRSHDSKLPLCVWQAGKSFRNEQDKTFKNIRFKEFYQLEFQCAYAEGSKANYLDCLYSTTHNVLEALVPHRSLEGNVSDRIPSYSEETLDIEDRTEGRVIELASISKRTDFDHPVVEVAIGLDRLLYARRDD
jgi:glycyl-tRNA synthetase